MEPEHPAERPLPADELLPADDPPAVDGELLRDDEPLDERVEREIERRAARYARWRRKRRSGHQASRKRQ